MNYQEHAPAPALARYIKCYYTLVCESDESLHDQALATGCLEVMFTLRGRAWQTKHNGIFHFTSPIELWGQIIEPLTFRSIGACEIFGIRFHPAAATLLLKEEIAQFNNQVINLANVLGNTIGELHARLQETDLLCKKIELVDTYLLRKLVANEKTVDRINEIQTIMKELTHADFAEPIESVAASHGITARNLQKIFHHYTGLSPKRLIKIHRFQKSLHALRMGTQSLTDIAYTCGYFDQSHFIREFKTFTHVAPSAFVVENSTALMASAGN